MAAPRRGWLLGLWLLPLGAQAEVPPGPPQESHFELGVGLGAVEFPAYPGAAETRKLLLPFPYIVYHGPHLDVENNKVRGIVIAGSRFSLDVDFDGAVSVDSSQVSARHGMPDLDWIGEAGPALRYHAWGTDDGDSSLDLILPVRNAVSARGLTLHDRGWVWAPRLEYDYDQGPPDRLLEFDAALWATWAGADLNDYVYGVTPQFATATRPAYEPGGGYAGYTVDLGMSLHRDALVYGCFLRYSNLGGAVFAASPLVSRTGDLSFGFAISWIFQRAD